MRDDEQPLRADGLARSASQRGPLTYLFGYQLEPRAHTLLNLQNFASGADPFAIFFSEYSELRRFKRILSVFELVRDFGFNDVSLTSNNALLPIVYWVHHKGLAEGIGSQIALRDERETIRRWLHVVLLKQIFGTHADTILAAIRRVFFEGDFGASYIKATHDKFPANEIGKVLSQHGKDQQVTNEFIEALLETQYEDKQAFSILALLAPNLDYKNGDFHKDHLHPKDAFKKRQLVAAKIPEADMEFYSNAKNWNGILNLRHLDANENKSKQTTPLSDWARGEAARLHVSETEFSINRELPEDTALLAFSRFRDFIAERRKILGAALGKVL
jgi:hypothetical protein